MEKLSCQEIYYTSSEKGIFSGYPGFGVRSCTKGMDSLKVDEIVESCSTGYAVYNDRILDMDRIEANPDVVYEYPPTYLYREVVLNNGSKRYVIGRTVYLAVDYGYFKGANACWRTGSNYFTHFFVFEQAPPVSFIEKLIRGSMFVPHNYSCSPFNEELKRLLTGNPEFLSPKVVDIFIEEQETEPATTSEMIPFVTGVIQMLKNQKVSSEVDVPRKMYMKCPGEKVEECLIALNLFPDSISRNIHYISNYMQGYGVPSGYEIAFVNAYNETELYEDNYVTVDLFTGENKNICSNYFVNQIARLIQQQEVRTAAQLIDFYLGLDDILDSEHELYYNIFIGAVSDLGISLEDLTELTIRSLPNIQLSPTQSTRFWAKVNKALTDGLTTTHGKDFLLAVNKIKEIMQVCPDKVKIQEDSVSYVTNILFSGRGNFGKIANDSNITTLLKLVNKDLVSSEDLFLASISESESIKVWKECISYFYNDCYEGNSKVLMTIVDSSLSEDTVNKLLETLYPLSKCADTLFDFFKNNPAYISRAKDTVSALVKFYGKNRFSDFVWLGHLESELKKIVAPIILDYFQNAAEVDVNNGSHELFDFLENVGIEQVSELNLWSIFNILAKKYQKEPLKDIKLFLSELEELEIPYQEQMDDDVNALFCLSKHELPFDVNISFLEAVIRCYPDDNQYIEQVFSVWLRNVDEFNEDEMGSLISNNKKSMTDSIVASVIITIWNNIPPDIKAKRENLILAVIDSYEWDRKKVEEFCLKCEDKDLKEFLLKSNNIFNKLIRKFL